MNKHQVIRSSLFNHTTLERLLNKQPNSHNYQSHWHAICFPHLSTHFSPTQRKPIDLGFAGDRINRLENDISLKQGAGTVEDVIMLSCCWRVWLLVWHFPPSKQGEHCSTSWFLTNFPTVIAVVCCISLTLRATRSLFALPYHLGWRSRAK